jgi:dGTPase
MPHTAPHTDPLFSYPAYNYCALPLAIYACRPDQSQGRMIEENESQYRTCFQRDRDRIIHSTAFRRLKYKTQVFIYHEGDHYRTRLTHTLEVAQIARTLARALLVNEDLAETIALAHDLGHTPFAHMGEDSLKMCMEHVGGFDHNDQSLRVLVQLEQKYVRWAGLNLTYETIEGVAKHNGPKLKKNQKADPSLLPTTLFDLSQKIDLKLDRYASLESQVAAIADDIAYNNHDIEDGIRAGFFTFDDIATLPMVGDILKNIDTEYSNIKVQLRLAELVREMIGRMVVDVIEQTQRNLNDVNPQSVDDVRNCGRMIVDFSSEMTKTINAIRKFLFVRMYKHYTIQRLGLKVEKIIPDLFNAFMRKYTLMPSNWQTLVEEAGGQTSDRARARVVADYIAGMTDRFALREHERLFDLKFD